MFNYNDMYDSLDSLKAQEAVAAAEIAAKLESNDDDYEQVRACKIADQRSKFARDYTARHFTLGRPGEEDVHILVNSVIK